MAQTPTIFLCVLYLGSIFLMVCLARSLREMSYDQPQSFLESLSSRDRGQVSAMACLKSGLYSIVKSGMYFFTAAANYSGEKLIPARL